MIHAFIDESGTPVISDQIFYVISAVLFSDADYGSNASALQCIRDRLAGGSQLKSKRIGSKLDLRKKILTELSKMNISIVAIAINKTLLNPESGLRFKTSMYKYCQRKLFRMIYSEMSSISVCCDRYGDSEFMKSFERYLDEHFPKTLFSEKKFKYSTPPDDPFLQISDFIGGSIRRVMQKNDGIEILEILRKITTKIDIWPINDKGGKTREDAGEIDKKIADYAFRTAVAKIKEETDPIRKEVYSYLAFDRFGDGGFVYGDEILRHLKECKIIEAEKDRDWLMHNVIAPLRDDGAIIVSCRDGYKIPDCQSDAKSFVEFVQEKTDPYLDRFQKIRMGLYLGTDTKYDILSDGPKLQKYIKPL